MTQTTSGLRSILSFSSIYDAFQNLVGARHSRSILVETYVRPSPGDRVLDVGCGTAAILEHLPDVDYYGYDISRNYIRAARTVYGKRGHFATDLITDRTLTTLPKFNIVLAIGLLHHLGDDDALALMRICKGALTEGGRFVSLDPCFAPGQPALARFIIAHDRGLNVRDQAGYVRLGRAVFGAVRSHIREDLLRVPYTHVVLECAA